MIQALPGTPTRNTSSSGEYRCSRRKQTGSPAEWTSWRRASTPEIFSPHGVEFHASENRDPMEVAFEDLCSRFNLYLQRLASSGHRERGLVILDKSTYETTLQRMSVEFRTLGTQWGVIRHLADTPFFVDSRASRVIQLADHVAYAVFRRYHARDAQYFDLISSKFDAHDGVVHGLAHKEPELRDCMCIACFSRRQRV